MSEHPTHKLDVYKDVEHKWVTFCRVCSREEENLSTTCPGKFVPLSVDKDFSAGTNLQDGVHKNIDKKAEPD